MTERVKIATETIAKASKGRELSEDNFFFVLIKDEKISFSKELDSIDDADECILYIPSYWDNTVKDKYGQQWWIWEMEKGTTLIQWARRWC